MPKIDFIVGAEKSASITQLEADLRDIVKRIEPIKIKVSVDENSVNSVQKQIQSMLESTNVSAGFDYGASQRTIEKFSRMRSSTLTSLSNSIRATLSREGVSQSEIDKIYQRIEDLNNKSISIDVDNATESELRNLLNEFDGISDRIKVLKSETIAPKIDNAALISINKLSSRVSDLMSKYPKLQQQNPGYYDELIRIQQALGGARTQADVRDLTRQFTLLEANIKRAGIEAESLGDKIKKRVISQLGNMAVSFAVSELRKAFGELYNYITDIDKAMVELKKVTDLTAESYDAFLRRAKGDSKALGATISDYVNATADFARLGYSMQDAENLAKTATVYKNVGDGIEDIGTASESIISTMKAFNIEASHSMDIVDAFNEVGNKFAISSTGIGEALTRSASALAVANNDLDESIALVVAGNAVVQNPETVGTALKTLSMRIRGAKTELEAAGESTEGMVDSVSKLRDQVKLLTKNKVDIMLDDSTFKSTYEILKEVSKVWNDISDVDQANLLELLGSKRGANVLASILTNFDDAERVIKTIAGDTGSAMKEQEKWLDGIEGRTSKLKTTAQGLAIELINSDVAKGTITFLTKIVELLDVIARYKGVIAGIVGVLGSVKLISSLPNIASGIMEFSGKISSFADSIKDSFNAKAFLHPIRNTVKELGDVAKNNIVSLEEFRNATNGAANSTGGLSNASEGAVVSLRQQSQAHEMTAATAAGLSLAIAGITAVISIGMVVWSAWNSSVQKHRQAAEDAKRSYEETSNSIEEYSEKIKEARKVLEESDSQTTRLEKTEELRDIEKELVSLYGGQAEGIDLVNGKLDEELAKLKDINTENAKDVWMKYNDRRTGFLQSEADEAADIFGGSRTKGFQIKGKSASDVRSQTSEIEDYINKIGGKLNVRSGASNYAISGDLNEQKRVLGELYDYVDKRQNEFDERTRQSILQAYNDATAKIDQYSATIQGVGESYFLKQDANSTELNSYLSYLKQIEDYKNAIKSEDFDTAASLMSAMQEWLKTIDQFPPIVQQYLKNLFVDAIPVDMQVILNLIPKVMKDENLQNALSKYKNEFGQIDIKLIYADAKKGTDNYKALKDSAKGYKESIEEIVDACNTYNKIELEDKFDKPNSKNSLADQIDNILEAEAGFDKLQKIYNDVKDGGQFDYGSLRQKDFLETFNVEGMEDAYNSFLETVAQYPNNLAKCQEAFNNLTTEYIKQTGVLDTLDEKNKTMTIAWLKNIGVANAEEVVNARLKQTKQALVDSLILTENEYKTLERVLGQTVDATETADNAFRIEQGVMKDLGLSAKELAEIIALSQQDATIATINQAKTRLQALKQEAEAYSKYYGYMEDLTSGYPGMVHGRADELSGKSASEIAKIKSDLSNYYAIEKAADAAINSIDNLDITTKYTPPANKSSKSGSGSGSGDKYLENWKEEVKVRKELLEQDQITEQQYYDWLRDAYKKKGGPGWSELSAEQQKKYRDEVASIESELYKWEKDQIQKSIDEQDAILKNKYANGLISEAEYQKQLAKVTEEGYNELRRKVEEEDLFGVDTTERLSTETELLEKIKSAHNAAYDAEIKDLEHLRAMNLITDEQYYAKHAALVAKYYANEKMYAEQLKEEEEKLYKERVDLIKKYSSAAKEAISSIMNIGKSLADTVNDLVTGLIDANSSNFDLQKNLLSHALKMNYITEEEYYKKLEDLYKTYYKSKSIYLDEYWENQEEIHEHEMDMLDEGASAMESIHAKVVDLIKSELEDAKDAIDETKEKYLDLIDIRKKALEKEKDENDYEKGRVEKLNSIAELQRQVNALANDTTAQGIAAYQKAYAELIKKQRELQEYEQDHAYDMAIEQLDAEADAYEKSAKSQTDAIDKQLDDNEWLVSEAWARLKGMNEELYNQLIDYTHKHSTEIKDSVTGEWEVAKKAFEDYINNVKEGYYSVEDILAHPENYYMGNPLDAYNAEAGMTYGEMRDAEKLQDSTITKQKEVDNYARVMGEFVESLADIMGESFQSVAGILNTLFPSPITELLVDGADSIASALGMVGINNSLMSTVMALGGITGVVEALGGLQTLAEGGTALGGVAIGGENITKMLTLIQTIAGYQQGIGTTNDMLQLILNATMAGPTQGSSVVSGLLMLGTVMTALLGAGTTLLGGGGAGATTLFSLLGVFKNLLTTGSLADTQTATSISGIGNIILNIANYALRLIGSADTTNAELSGLRAFLVNGWRTVHSVIQGILGGGLSFFGNDDKAGVSTTAEVLGGFTGTLSAIGSAVGAMLENNNPYQAVSLDSLPAGTSSSFAKMLGKSLDLTGSAISAVGEIGAKILPNIVSSRTGDVTVSPQFNITSQDPDGVANAILQLMPKIADFTISTMMDSASNRGVKRNVSALI